MTPDGHFYSDLSFYHTNEIKQAVEQLQSAAQLSKKPGKELLLEKCYWFLGIAYLELNDVENAVPEFQQVIEIKGQYVAHAQPQMVRIKALKDNYSRFA